VFLTYKNPGSPKTTTDRKKNPTVISSKEKYAYENVSQNVMRFMS